MAGEAFETGCGGDAIAAGETGEAGGSEIPAAFASSAVVGAAESGLPCPSPDFAGTEAPLGLPVTGPAIGGDGNGGGGIAGKGRFGVTGDPVDDDSRWKSA